MRFNAATPRLFIFSKKVSRKLSCHQWKGSYNFYCSLVHFHSLKIISLKIIFTITLIVTSLIPSPISERLNWAISATGELKLKLLNQWNINNENNKTTPKRRDSTFVSNNVLLQTPWPYLNLFFSIFTDFLKFWSKVKIFSVIKASFQVFYNFYVFYILSKWCLSNVA